MMRRVLIVGAVLAALFVVDIVLVSVGSALFPGSMKWTAPILCPAEQPDAFVIRTTQTDSEGTSYSFSLFCMGERGDFSEAGTWRPLLLLVLFTWGFLVVVTYAGFVVVTRRFS